MTTNKSSAPGGTLFVAPAGRQRLVLPAACDPSGHRGYIYVLEFSTGIIKLGSTTNPAGRIGRQLESGRCFGAELRSGWVSEPHDRYVCVESELVRSAAIGGQLVAGREWFRGLDFENMVNFAGRTIAKFNPTSSAPVRQTGAVARFDALRTPRELPRIEDLDLSPEARAVLQFGVSKAKHLESFPVLSYACARFVWEAERLSLSPDDVRQGINELDRKGHHTLTLTNESRPTRRFSLRAAETPF